MRAVVLKLECAPETRGAIVAQPAGPPRAAALVRLGWGPRICIYKKLPRSCFCRCGAVFENQECSVKGSQLQACSPELNPASVPGYLGRTGSPPSTQQNETSNINMVSELCICSNADKRLIIVLGT